MEQAQPSRLDREATAAAFGKWLTDCLTDRGYNLGPRGGGRRRLAEETGLGPTTIGRLLAGEAHNPDPETLRLIAAALPATKNGEPKVEFAEVLIRAGVITAAELRQIQDPTPVTGRPLVTPEQAAAGLGITDPAAVALFVANAQAAQQLQRMRSDDERAE